VGATCGHPGCDVKGIRQLESMSGAEPSRLVSNTFIDGKDFKVRGGYKKRSVARLGSRITGLQRLQQDFRKRDPACHQA